jgi:3-hydroxyisobutyrate dehydrogenase
VAPRRIERWSEVVEIADQEKVRVGIIGVGLMGAAMGHRLLDQGVELVAWSRHPEHLEPLRERGAEGVGSPEDVVEGAEVVITMLPTAEIILEVVEPLLASWPAGTVWLQMSSVGTAGIDGLVRLAAAHGVTLVDAPVSGSTKPAREGRLTILASGPESTRPTLEPVFAVLGSRVLWVGEAGTGSRLKLATNHWLVTSLTALAETMQLCKTMGLDQQPFVELLDGGPLGSAYAVEKLAEMLHHDYPAGFPVRLALKDLELVREVKEDSHAQMPVLEAALDRFRAAAVAHAEEDLAAVYELGS